jgi:PAS domain S-box-containing protein
MEVKHRSRQERVYQAERNLGFIRLVIILFNTVVYLLLVRSNVDTITLLADIVVAISVVYGSTIVITEPYRRFPVLVSSYFTTVTDALLITLWLAATGGYESPFVGLWYASVASIAFRFGVWETVLAATVYGASHLGLIYLTEPALPRIEHLITPIGYIYFVGLIGALLSREFSNQISARLEAQESYRHLYENAVMGIYRANRDGQFTSINPALARVFGYENPTEALVELNANRLYIEPKRRADFHRLIEEHDLIAGFESEVQRKDGSTIWISESARAVRGPEGHIFAYEGIIDDITTRKHSEDIIQAHNRALIQANKELALARKRAEEAVRIKDEFLANMSHELRTPLNAIIGYSEIVGEGIAGPLTTMQQDNMKRIIQNAEDLLQLINDVLDLAKIEAGRLELQWETFEIRPWLEDVRSQIEGLAQEKNLRLLASVASGDALIPLRAMVTASADCLNLLSNAIVHRAGRGDFYYLQPG